MKYATHSKLGISLIVVITGFVGIISLQKSTLGALDIVQDKDTYLNEQLEFSATAQVQKEIPSFGFNNLMASWSFLQFIQYFGDGEAREVTGYPTVTDYFEDIVNRDPNFMQSHLVMSAANSIFAGQPQETVRLMNEALGKIDPTVPSYPFLLWTYKAADEILFLGDIEAAHNSYLEAAKWASEWASYPGNDKALGQEMAQRYKKSAEFLASDPDPTQAQIGAWMSILSSTKDPMTVDHIIGELEKLGVKVSISEDGRLVIDRPGQV